MSPHLNTQNASTPQHYVELPPPPGLKDCVIKLWAFRGVLSELTLPSGSCDLVFNTGDHLFLNSATSTDELMPRCILAGQITSPIRLHTHSSADSVGIRFRPSGLARVFGIDMSAFTDSPADLSEALGLPSALLLDELDRTPSSTDRLRLLAGWLQSVHRAPDQHPRIDRAIRAILTSPHDISMADIARQASTTSRSLQRDFKRQIGITAKHFQRIVRLKRVVDHASRHRSATWSAVAHAFGYSDQSHLVRECKSLYGVAPTKLVIPRGAWNQAFDIA